MSAPALSAPASSTAADLLSLTKPRLSAEVVCTTAGGMWLARASLSAPRMLMVLLATAGIVGAANALNCYLERDSDRFMRRTRNRPLPAGRMDPGVALGFGLSLAAICLPALWVAGNPLTAALAAVAFLSYVLVYTPLKARSSSAMLVGAVPGALPPLMGWTAMTDRIDLAGLVLFGILFFWQLPHFIAIALFRKDEYAAAGLKTVPLEKGDANSRLQIMGFLIVLLPLTVMPWALHLAGVGYLVVAIVFGAAFFGHAAWGWVKRLDGAWARQLFFLSLVHLTALFVALMLDSAPRT